MVFSENNLNNTGRPLMALVRSDTEEMKKRFPGAVELYKNVGRGPAFEIFSLIYEDNNYYVSDLNDCMAVLDVDGYFSVKYIPKTISKKEILEIYKNLNDEILSKMEESTHNYIGVVFYKDSNNIWYYSLYTGKGVKREISGYGLLSEFSISS